jgi:hypothetical protein
MKPYPLLFTLLVTPWAALAQPTSWLAYVVPESGAVAQIPTTIFTEDGGKPEAGYGRRFVTADGRANLTVESIANHTSDSPAAFLAKQNPPSNIAYRKVTARYFVVSSFRDDKIWYNRCNFTGRFVNCVLINYPAVEKKQWDSVVTRISNTLASR